MNVNIELNSRHYRVKGIRCIAHIRRAQFFRLYTLKRGTAQKSQTIRELMHCFDSLYACLEYLSSRTFHVNSTAVAIALVRNSIQRGYAFSRREVRQTIELDDVQTIFGKTIIRIRDKCR